MFTDQWSWWHGCQQPCTARWNSWLPYEEGRACQHSPQRSSQSGGKRKQTFSMELFTSTKINQCNIQTTAQRDTLSVSHLIVYKLGGVFQDHFLLLQRGVAGCQCQTTQGVAPGAPLLDDWHDVVFDGSSQGYTVGANTNVRATVNDTFWSTLLTYKLSMIMTCWLELHLDHLFQI